ncbi:hypothetical protein HPP92_016318 [Vanilla planifolia]|uniref:Cytochrome P450 n=1 Tax=Vanilla planifolia TaxID=51239 RepID=A0A835QDV7_VANPL|nr:hypothetical protein HPP92_016318 [Vanilla planifolia]
MDFLDVVYMAAVLILAVLWWLHCFSSSDTSKANLPPGPRGWPLVGNLFQIILQRRPFMYIVRDLRRLYGPIFLLRMGQRTLVVVSSSDLIHEALVRRGPLFASRPPDSPTRIIFSSGKRTINSAPYGPLWRSLRRNLVSQLVSPSRLPSFSWIRHWAVSLLLSRLREASGGGAAAVEIMPHLRLTICSILACICFGVKVAEEKIKEIEEVLKEIMLMTTPKLADFLPALTPLFRSQLRAARKLRQRQLDCLLPLVRARRAFVERGVQDSDWEMLVPAGEAYVDSLLTLDAAGPLGDEELVTLCSEVMSAGTDTSATSLEWAMLHIVLDQPAQERLHREVAAAAVASGERIADEEDVEKMPYLTAVVKETLRRHPPSHFLLACRHAGGGARRVPHPGGGERGILHGMGDGGSRNMGTAEGVAAGEIHGRWGRVGHRRHGYQICEDDAVRCRPTNLPRRHPRHAACAPPTREHRSRVPVGGPARQPARPDRGLRFHRRNETPTPGRPQSEKLSKKS